MLEFVLLLESAALSLRAFIHYCIYLYIIFNIIKNGLQDFPEIFGDFFYGERRLETLFNRKLFGLRLTVFVRPGRLVFAFESAELKRDIFGVRLLNEVRFPFLVDELV